MLQLRGCLGGLARIATCVGLSALLLCPSLGFAQTAEESAVAAMRAIEGEWAAAIKEQRLLLTRCRNETWGVIRFEPGASLSMDLRKTDSLISPYRGIIKIRGSIQTNDYSPKATGFSDKYTEGRTLCHATIEQALKAVEASDWSPYNDKPRVFEFTAIYNADGKQASLAGGNAVFMNVLGDKITAPENAPNWRGVVLQK